MSNTSNDELFTRAAALLEVLSVGDGLELNDAYEANDLELMDALVRWYERRMNKVPELIQDVREVY